LKQKFKHFTNIFSQFSNDYNKANELYNPDLNIILKTKRIEYVTTMPRFSIDPQYTEKMTMQEKAERNLVNEMKMWGQRYMLLSAVIGCNITGLLMITLFKNHGRKAKFLFSSLGGWITYSLLSSKTLDKIYYPLNPIFDKYRNLEKKYSPEEFQKIISFEVDMENTKSEQKFADRREITETMTMLDKIDDEIQTEKDEFAKDMDQLIKDLHTGYINEEHFANDSEKYKEFLDAYIH
jgi:hypothetical protein